MREAMKATQNAEANATLIRWLSLVSLAFLAPYAIVVVLDAVAVTTAPPPAPCHALRCAQPAAFGDMTALLGCGCLLAPTLGGLLAGALAWLQGIGQAIRQRSGFWLIGLLLAGLVVMAPIVALVVASATANTTADGRPMLPFGITPAWDPAWDFLSVPLLVIPMALVTLLFGIVGVPTPARQTAQTAKQREAVEEAGV
jgi:hypothetical protein